jgi:MEDS: MEthanogen/methylotroph, DcmR Sensory domain
VTILLLQSLQRYVGGALGSGDSAVVIASTTHRRDLAKRLKWCGIDLQLAQACGRYQELDAESVITGLESSRAAESFEQLVGTVMLRAIDVSPLDGFRVVVYGEVAGLLMARNRSEIALQLEGLWNDSVAADQHTMLCGYPISNSPTKHNFGLFCALCSTHSAVVSCDARVGIATEEQRCHAVERVAGSHVASWESLYEDAVREQNQQNLFRKVEVAESLIMRRLEASNASQMAERRSLLDALATLLILKKHRLGFG